MEGDKEISEMMAQKCVITDEVETEEAATIVEKKDNAKILEISDTSENKEDPPVENGNESSGKTEEPQVKKPGKEKQEEVLTTVPNYLEVVKNLDYPRFTSCQFFELIQAEPLQDIYNNVEELVGDLFAVDPSWAFAHCVSEDMAMFKGIALEFRRRFNKVRFIRNQRAPIGHVAVLHHVPKVPTNNNDRFVFYMVTKQMFSHKPTYYHIYCALVRLRIMCEALNVTKLAMPRIASGCDMKDFRKVKHLIHVAFVGSPVQIRIYLREERLGDFTVNGNRLRVFIWGPTAFLIMYRVIRTSESISMLPQS